MSYIEVQDAKNISEKYDKAVVIITSWDAKDGKFYTATYGTEPQYKDGAAKGGEICAKALGANLELSTVKEDFRTASRAARFARAKELLVETVAWLKGLRGVCDAREWREDFQGVDNLFAKLQQFLKHSEK